jgi:hypothetical protein
MEEGGGTGDTTGIHGGDAVCISIPDEVADDGATPLTDVAVGGGATPSPTHLQAVRPPPPPLGAAVGDGPTHRPGVAEGGAPHFDAPPPVVNGNLC